MQQEMATKFFHPLSIFSQNGSVICHSTRRAMLPVATLFK